MSKKICIKTLLNDIEQVVKTNGKAGLQEKINAMAEPQGLPDCKSQPCGTNQIWSSTFCKCVDNIG
jgi:hypothetical protein